MTPSASQVYEICGELGFIAKIGEEEKFHISTKTIQPAGSWWTRVIRFFSWETKEQTIRYIREKTDRALEFADQLTSQPELLGMLVERLNGCVRDGYGIPALIATYQGRHKAVSELEVINDVIRRRLPTYRRLLTGLQPTAAPPTPFLSPLALGTPGPEY